MAHSQEKNESEEPALRWHRCWSKQTRILSICCNCAQAGHSQLTISQLWLYLSVTCFVTLEQESVNISLLPAVPILSFGNRRYWMGTLQEEGVSLPVVLLIKRNSGSCSMRQPEDCVTPSRSASAAGQQVAPLTSSHGGAGGGTAAGDLWLAIRSLGYTVNLPAIPCVNTIASLMMYESQPRGWKWFPLFIHASALEAVAAPNICYLYSP